MANLNKRELAERCFEIMEKIYGEKFDRHEWTDDLIISFAHSEWLIYRMKYDYHGNNPRKPREFFELLRISVDLNNFCS